jgi:hypothetical protein
LFQGLEEWAMDYVPLDPNGDGVVDSYGVDSQGDGLYELRLADLDGDGVFDTHMYDPNQNGYTEYVYVDINEDGITDYNIADANENGVNDAYDYGYTAPGSAGPSMPPVSMTISNPDIPSDIVGEVIADSKHDMINTSLTPDGETYIDRNGR